MQRSGSSLQVASGASLFNSAVVLLSTERVRGQQAAFTLPLLLQMTHQ